MLSEHSRRLLSGPPIRKPSLLEIAQIYFDGNSKDPLVGVPLDFFYSPAQLLPLREYAAKRLGSSCINGAISGLVDGDTSSLMELCTSIADDEMFYFDHIRNPGARAYYPSTVGLEIKDILEGPTDSENLARSCKLPTTVLYTLLADDLQSRNLSAHFCTSTDFNRARHPYVLVGLQNGVRIRSSFDGFATCHISHDKFSADPISAHHVVYASAGGQDNISVYDKVAIISAQCKTGNEPNQKLLDQANALISGMPTQTRGSVFIRQ